MRRTRDRLGDALVELLVQKPFDDITVQDVLDARRSEPLDLLHALSR